MSTSLPLAAVVVTFFPDNQVLGRLLAIRRQVDRLVIVDNGSPAESRTELETWAAAHRATVLANAQNLGLAKALNQGMAWAEVAGCEWAVTFDQDSTPQPGLVAALVATAGSSAKPARVAMVGAHTFDERTGREDWWLQPARFGFHRARCEGSDLSGVSFVITSGALTRVRAWRELGGFDEGLFIDYLDHDLCLRAHRAGWEILVSAGARLAHNLGSKREVAVSGRNLRPTFHSAARHYYMARNRVLMWQRHGWRFPHWWLFDACFGVISIVSVLLGDDQRLAKLGAMLRGTWDGLLGRRGPQRAAREDEVIGLSSTPQLPPERGSGDPKL